MRYSDFKIVETRLREAGEVYVIGDSHAKAMGGSNNLAQDGAQLQAIAGQARRVPDGATVWMTGGHNDVAAGKRSGEIARLVKTIIDDLKERNCTVNYVLFPEGSSNTNQENMGPTRGAITSAVNVARDLNGCSMQSDGIHCSLGSYRGIVSATTPTERTAGPDDGTRGGQEPNRPTELKAGPPYPPEDMDAVRALQTKLEELGYDVGSTGIDGKYGPRTSRAVKAYKTDFNVQDTDNGRTISNADIQTMQSAEAVEDPTPTGNEGSSGGSSSYDLPPLSDRDDVQGAVKAVLDFIAQYESRGHYDIRNGGSRDPAILDMTVAEVQQYQRGWRNWPNSASAAIGRYQYTQGTLSDYIARMGVDANTQKFDPEFQDRLAIFDMRDRSRLDGWLAGSVSDEAFVNELSQVWAAIPNSSNQSTYRGIANNRRGIDYDAAVDIIGQIRTGIA